jgi:hypothetical protein
MGRLERFTSPVCRAGVDRNRRLASFARVTSEQYKSNEGKGTFEKRMTFNLV